MGDPDHIIRAFIPDKDVAITPNEDMKHATLAKHHARSLEIAPTGRCLLLKENVEDAEQKSVMAQRHVSSASIATLLSSTLPISSARENTSVALADGVCCLHS